MQWVAGIDVGTGFTKAVIMRSEGEPVVLGRGSARTGVDFDGAAAKALTQAREAAGLPPDASIYVATTGFGRHSVGFRDIQITEITCAARGSYFLFPESSAVLDVGSQSTRAIGLTGKGRVSTFKSNDKCAAGSGAFIQRAAKYLQTSIEDVGDLSMNATHPQPISSVCAVLAESEIINHVSSGVGIEDIFRGIHDSLAERAATLLRRVGMGKQLTFVGGVARQRGMVRALENYLKIEVHVTDYPEFVCAMGAALLGRVRLAATRPSLIAEAVPQARTTAVR